MQVNPEKVAATVKKLLARARKKDVTKLEPDDMLTFMEETVPFGHYKCLTYFGFLLATLWKHYQEKNFAELEALLALGCVFTEQVAVEGGQHYKLGWRLTGLEEPPWSKVQARKANSDEAHARLADPRWVTANLAYQRDLDLMAERTKKMHQPPQKSKKGDGRGAEGGGD